MSDDELAGQVSQMRRLARPLVGYAGAELDDLVQEGLIACWLDDPPRFRMLNWLRYLRRGGTYTIKELDDDGLQQEGSRESAEAV